MGAKPSRDQAAPRRVLEAAALAVELGAKPQKRKRDRRRLRAKPDQIKRKNPVPPTQIATPNRFDPKTAEDLTREEVRFGNAMRAYLSAYKSAGWTCGQVLDVLMSLGYRNRERDFEVCVHQFTIAIEALKKRIKMKKKKVGFPTWSEVLQTAIQKGWYLRADKSPPLLRRD